ncbi:MAG: UDP-N-acetylmuramoyl-L-alanyl-D-glutamate--2,6-diaminopimelate ligase [Proteobacteria bacterium]|nr:UDP-N-acetylmuramoyl-L-alanyl-D-glutamate--2,6-diaminopimelate ligase [Pseudomonadota bacterium]MBI3496585.1 UDP-N-acetylmuramoyl-L-alanyl-D-glutamate--2,6-diaminopimelate ligase [Pseudomonadota bacterium]
MIPPGRTQPTPDDVVVQGLTADSRTVRPGYLFAALPGSHADGRRFIAAAIEHGAGVVLAPTGTELPAEARGVVLVTDAEPRRLLAKLAARFYGAQPRTVAAVTGTSGKTSSVDFLRQIWTRLGRRAASIGTLGVIRPGRPTMSSLTTPDPVLLHETLADLALDGVDHLAIEASSHGLDQYRLDGLVAAAAGFTNLGRDHLDYHPSREAYLAAKRGLFERVLEPKGKAVINADAPESAEIAAICRRRGIGVVGYGASETADLRLTGRRAETGAQILSLMVSGSSREVRLPLVGAFQAMNALQALGLAIATGAEPAAAADALAFIEGVPGRLQLAGRRGNGAEIYVDYAHKPDALEAVLTTLRPHVQGRLWVVFGCGGDRDAGKRPIMGGLAAKLADRVVVTDDNPRSENPAAIRRQVMAGSPAAREIGDRAEAIHYAVAALGPGDVLVVAGKGHEQGQIIGSQVRPFDDAAVVQAALGGLEGVAA